jgi:hypothetical protein
MALVVDFHGLRVNVGFEGLIRVGEVGQLEGVGSAAV